MLNFKFLLICLLFTHLLFAQLNTPNLIYPANNDTIYESGHPMLSWTAVEGATFYGIKFVWESNVPPYYQEFTHNKYTTEANPTSLSVNDYLFPGKIKWKVIASNDNQVSIWSDERTFTFISDVPLADPPSLIAPYNGYVDHQSDAGSNVLVCSNIPGADYYDFELSQNSLFNDTVSTIIKSSSNPYVLTDDLNLSTNTWYWRVRARNSLKETGWSGFRWFIYYADATSILDGKIIYEYSLSQNYPNPFNPTTTINYSIPKTSFVTLKVYDELGREITNLVNEEKHAGNYNVEFYRKDLSSGIYFYRINAGEYSQTRKMILMK